MSMPRWARHLKEDELLELLPETAAEKVRHRGPKLSGAFNDVASEVRKLHPIIVRPKSVSAKFVTRKPTLILSKVRITGHRRTCPRAYPKTVKIKARPRLVTYPSLDSLRWAVGEEFRLLLCTRDRKYKTLRGQLQKYGAGATIAMVATISASIGGYPGIAAGASVPLCAVCLRALLQVGKEAFCKSLER